MSTPAERGYLIPAINSDTTDYVACARHLADTIREWHPDADITILTKEMLPNGDQGGYANDWQCYTASPYQETIKLEADMWCASPVDHWWELFKTHEVVISQGCRDFYDRPGQSRQYRQLFDRNNLPDVYNGITYWRRSPLAQEFFDLVKNIFEQWSTYRTLLKFPEEVPSTDVVYAMAAVILGPERVTLPLGYGPTMIHMKKGMIPTTAENWTDELVWEHTDPGIRINTVTQWGLVHYHVKDVENE